ncbi:MAG: DUF29 family protein [Acetobacteraceae bacterium]|nr:DUF29 family protein [Acetobacteraceae bacterium]MBV8575099.1 DUF29 family protein [Acetobacteraceae bacterium]
MLHLLKWVTSRSDAARAGVSRSRSSAARLARHLNDNPSLRPGLDQAMAHAWIRRAAGGERNLPAPGILSHRPARDGVEPWRGCLA